MQAQSNIQQLTDVSDLNHSLNKGLVCIEDIGADGRPRFSFVTRHFGIILEEGHSSTFNDLKELDTRHDVAVYDVLDRRVYRLRPHETDMRCYAVAGTVRPQKAKPGMFNVGSLYFSKRTIRFGGKELPAGTRFECRDKLSPNSFLFSVFLDVLGERRAPIELDIDGAFHKNGKSAQILDRPTGYGGYTDERDGYLLLCPKSGAIYLPKAMRYAIKEDAVVGSRLMPVIQFLDGEKVLDITLLNNKLA